MNLQELEQELKQRSQQTEKERLVAVAKHAQEQAEAKVAKQAELDAQNAEMKAIQAKYEQRKRDEAAAELTAKQAEHASRIRLENEQNARDAELNLQRVNAERLEKMVAEAQWMEEQHRKSLEPTVLPDYSLKGRRGLYVEDTSGNAAEGTDGQTPDTPLMSEHMRRILRQINKVD